MDNKPMNNDPCNCEQQMPQQQFPFQVGDTVAIHMDNYKIMGRPYLRNLDNKVVTIDKLVHLPQGDYCITKEYPNIKLPIMCIQENMTIYRKSN